MTKRHEIKDTNNHLRYHLDPVLGNIRSLLLVVRNLRNRLVKMMIELLILIILTVVLTILLNHSYIDIIIEHYED